MTRDQQFKRERIEIVPCLHGKLTSDGKMSEPDIHWILKRRFERHPEASFRRSNVRINRSRTATRQGKETELVRVTIRASADLDGYDASQDRDLYEYFLAEDDSVQTGR